MRVRRASPLWAVAAAGGVLWFVGCLHLADRGSWFRGPEPPIESPPDRLVRVRLGGGDPGRSASLEVVSPFSVKQTTGSSVLVARHGALPAATVRCAGAAGIDLGGELLAANDILLTPDRDAAIVLDKETYRGALRIQRVGDGLFFDNHVDVESYLRGVLRGELPRDFHPESFKTLAVAARTYVLYQKQHGPAGRSFDVYDHEGSQVYIGVRGEDRVALEAVAETCGEVCTWNGGGGDQLFCTFYSSACGGASQPVSNVKPAVAAIPPLAGNVECNDCYLARFFRWDPVEITREELTKRLVARYPALSTLGTITGLEPKARTPDGRIIRMLLIGGTGRNETLVGEDFRLCVGGRVLKSTNFEVETRPKCFVFKNGKGFGHGVGLCQHGMETKARRGMNYRQILKVYYPRSDIKKLY